VELSWPMKLRIAGAAAVGVVLIGILAWPLAASTDPSGAVSVAASSISVVGALLLIVLAFASGIIGYFVSRPWGREIGVLAVPCGLAVWAVRGGTMAGLMQMNPTLPARRALLGAMTWEPAFWLVVVAAGFAGVLLGHRIAASLGKGDKPQEKPKPGSARLLNIMIGLVCSVIVAQLCIRLFARDAGVRASQFGAAVGQAPAGQVVFALLVSFGAAGFIIKKLLNVSYIWTVVAAAALSALMIGRYVRSDLLEHFVRHWPGPLFPDAVVSILPLQMVAFGTLGAIIGYWLAVRYDFWRKHAI